MVSCGVSIYTHVAEDSKIWGGLMPFSGIGRGSRGHHQGLSVKCYILHLHEFFDFIQMKFYY